jgi:putative transposase
MSEPWLLSEAQMRRIEPYFPLSHGIPRVNDRRIVSGIIYVIRGGLMWRDAPKAHGPHKTIYNPVLSLSKGASSAGAVWACSTASLPSWRQRRVSQIRS